MRFCIALVSQKFPNAQFSVLHLKGFETIILIFPFMFCIEGPCLLSKVHLSMSLTFNEKNGKVSDDCWHWKLNLKVKFWHFLTPPHYTNSQNSINSFGYVNFYAKIFLIFTPRLKTWQPVLQYDLAQFWSLKLLI